MPWHSRIILSIAALASLPTALMAQGDICQPAAPFVPEASRAELYRIQTEDRAARDAERRDWQVTTIPLKNAITEYSLRTLCIFRVEVVPQQRMLLIRAPRDTAMIDAIKEAIKAIDAPPPLPVPQKSVELTGYVLAAVDVVDPTLKPVPQSLQPVVNQLKSLLPSANFYLLDTVIARGIDGHSLGMQGGVSFRANAVRIQAGAVPVVRLDMLQVQIQGSGTNFNTSIDVPVGTQVVVGNATSQDGKSKTLILVVSAKILD